MKECLKMSQNDAFYLLDKPQKDVVMMLFERELTDEEIAKSVKRTRRTLVR